MKTFGTLLATWWPHVSENHFGHLVNLLILVPYHFPEAFLTLSLVVQLSIIEWWSRVIVDTGRHSLLLPWWVVAHLRAVSHYHGTFEIGSGNSLGLMRRATCPMHVVEHVVLFYLYLISHMQIIIRLKGKVFCFFISRCVVSIQFSLEGMNWSHSRRDGRIALDWVISVFTQLLDCLTLSNLAS